MKKRIYWSICVSAAGAVLLMLALCMYAFYSLMLTQARDELASEYAVIEKGFANTGTLDETLVEMLDRQFFRTRVTLVGTEGQVLYDSGGSRGLENHAGRPEIASALQKGTGEDVRYSETLHQNMYYYAQRLPDGRVLRIAKPTQGIAAAFESLAPLMVLLLLLIVAAASLLSARLSKGIIRPLERFAESCDAEYTPAYEELEPVFRRIREQNSLIGEQMEHLRQERDTIRTITMSMKEGLVLLDLGRNILSCNPSAVELLDAPSGSYEGKSLLVLARAPVVGDCVEKALAGTAADALLQRGQEHRHLFANPVYDGAGGVCGVILLVLDVTRQQQAEQIRRDFAANVSHELKTPLTSISGFAEMLEAGMVRSEEDARRFAGTIRTEAARLISLTDDIIRLSRIEQNETFDTEQVDLFTICQEVARDLAFAAEQKDVHIRVEGDVLALRANRRMLDELVRNLTDNAVKYNCAGGSVTLSVRRDADYAVLEVADTGIGIPEEHRARIFERFYRVDASRSKQTGGTGLGLSIVKHIVERHNGSIALESVVGEGSRIIARLPIGTENEVN